MFRPSHLIVAAGLLALGLTPSLASDSGRASFDPSKLVAEDGVRQQPPDLDRPRQHAEPGRRHGAAEGSGGTLPISTAP